MSNLIGGFLTKLKMILLTNQLDKKLDHQKNLIKKKLNF
jgi:hypothetical protein